MLYASVFICYMRDTLFLLYGRKIIPIIMRETEFLIYEGETSKLSNIRVRHYLYYMGDKPYIFFFQRDIICIITIVCVYVCERRKQRDTLYLLYKKLTECGGRRMC